MRRLVLVVALLVSRTVMATDLPKRVGMFPTGGGAAFAMLDSTIDIAIRGPIVEATVTQTFRNDTDRATEATYIFPLPADAAVSAMAMTYGTRTIHAAIEKRADAQRRYEQAVANGVAAAVIEQERPDIFTQTVSAIPAHGSVTVTLRFDTVARYRGTTWELAVPLVVAPRFVPGTASGRPTTGVGRAPDTDRAPDASRVTPGGAPGAGGKTEMNLMFADAVVDVASPSHAITGAGRAWKLIDPKSDHDALVRWRATAPNAGWVEQDSDGGYAAIVVESGASLVRKAGAIRATIVLDRAATTRGDADAVMHPLVRALFESFTKDDRVAVAGSDTVATTSPADAARAIEAAWARPAGALDLTRALGAVKGDGASAIVLVSDGLVADDAAAIAAAQKLGVPVHVIGFGPSPNRSLLGAIATATGGTVRFASTADDLHGLAREVAIDAASPPVPFAVTWGALAASDVVPATLPRLGVGQAILVLARVKQAQRANARARSDVFAIETMPNPRVVDGATAPGGAIARRWARDRLDELLAKRDATATTAHALRYGLVSPYTTMVAIGTEVVVEGGVKHSTTVPVSVPAGMRWQEVQRQVHVDTETTLDKTKEPGDRVSKGERPVAKTPPAAEDTRNTRNHEPKKNRGDDEKGADRDGEADDSPRRPSPAPQPTSTLGGEATGGVMDVEIAQTSSYSRRLKIRLALGLGAGATRAAGATAGTLVVDGRLEVGYLTVGGLDVSLWFVDGIHAQGSVLASIARRGIARWFELGAGAGVHVTGNGFGPAGSLSLRIRPHLRGPGAYLRYDGALISNAGTKTGENTGTVGFEWTF